MFADDESETAMPDDPAANEGARHSPSTSLTAPVSAMRKSPPFCTMSADATRPSTSNTPPARSIAPKDISFASLTE